MIARDSLAPHVTLGLGLTRLGRPWGVRRTPVPTDEESDTFLTTAIASGIRVFDTAPSYGLSEARFGRFLSRLLPAVRGSVFVATKCGEQWDGTVDRVTVDHSYDALIASLEMSARSLGTIDLLQLHRSNAAALKSADVRRAMAEARAGGVRAIGASVSSVDDARIALGELDIEWLQIPYYRGQDQLGPVFALAQARQCRLLINRPFGMGALAASGDPSALTDAFAFILEQTFGGAILSGTVSPLHLRENLVAFALASRQVAGRVAP